MKNFQLTQTRRLALYLLCLNLLFSTGCEKAGRIQGLAPAKGVVLYKGTPVEGASLTFIPDHAGPSTEQRPATAVSDASGCFTMMTLQPNDGVFPGKYTVVITKDIPERVYTNEEMQEFFRQGQPTPIPKSNNELPKQYSSPQTSPLNVDINQKGDKLLKFELDDKSE